ncbi:MAG: type II toxin-antitoxin system RelE/ParE family toxin [Rhizomicrobium sp.]
MEEGRTLELRYSKRAREQLDAIHSYYHSRNERAADDIVLWIRRTCERLTRFPDLGRAIYPLGTRAFSVTKYPFVVAYAVIGSPPRAIRIAGIVHTSLGEWKF